ncbi:MAG: M64 family metallopeptidase [Myxococcota bacterium]
MRSARREFFTLAFGLAMFVSACGGNDAGSDTEARGGAVSTSSAGVNSSGGAVSQGGNNGNSQGGATAQGGASAQGGAPNAGGTTNNAGGTTSNAGGTTSGGKAAGGNTSGGAPSSGGSTASGGSNSSGGASKGGATSNSGGKANGGSSSGGAASGGATSSGGSTASGGAFTLDCGPNGWAVEAHGPPENRVNYAILGDGYQAADLVAGGLFEQHINKAMAKRFSIPIGEPYSRYRKFVNICAIKLVSTGAICSGSSALGCCGDDDSRLASCNNTAANNAFKANLPASFVLDWRAVVLNGKSWWNTGSALMLWSGAHAEAAGAALHEGGHGFHQLADEYGGTGSGCSTERAEVNSTTNATTTAGKWDLWLRYTQTGATGLQTTIEGSRYCDAGQYRPSSNSMMNLLFGNDPNTSFNSVSREQAIFTIWRAVVPIDSTNPPAGAVNNPSTLSVKVIDPAVIDVDWSVDGTVVAAKGGEVFNVAARSLSSGTHTINAKAYDNASEDWVRYRSGSCPSSVTGNYCARSAWSRSQQTVTWSVTVP